MNFGRKNENTEESATGYKKAFGQFSSMRTQRIETLDPTIIELDTQEDVAGGIQTIDFDEGNITIKKSGTYLIIGAPQVSKTIGNRNRWIDFWLRVNNVDVANSNIRRVLTNQNEKDVVTMNAVSDLNRGDTLQFIMAAETHDEGIGIESIEPDGEPGIPSIIVTLVQLD